MRAHPRGGPAADRRRLAGVVGRRCASASSTRWPTTSTRRAALAAVFDWVREANRARPPSRSATPTCARCSTCSGSTNLLDVDGAEAPAEAPRAAATRASAPARRATTPRPIALRDELRELGWEVRDGPDGPELLPRQVIVYGRNPVREALRGPRTVQPHLGDQERRCASRGCRRGRRASTVATAEEIERRCGSRRASGHLRRGLARSATPTPTRCWRRADAADRRARSGPGSSEPRRDLPHGRVRRRGRRGDPRAALGRGDAGRVQGLGRRRRAPAGGARPQPRRLPGRGQGRRRCGATEPTPTGAIAYDERRLRGRRRAGARVRGAGAAPAGGGGLRRAGVGAAARPDRVAERERRGRGAAVRGGAPA